VTEGEAADWHIAISLLAAWRAAHSEHRQAAVAQRLAEVGTRGGPAAVEQAVLGLADVAGMFIELYADCAGTSLDAVIEEAVALRGSDGSPTG
jgi:hypothetical protein